MQIPRGPGKAAAQILVVDVLTVTFRAALICLRVSSVDHVVPRAWETRRAHPGGEMLRSVSPDSPSRGSGGKRAPRRPVWTWGVTHVPHFGKRRLSWREFFHKTQIVQSIVSAAVFESRAAALDSLVWTLDHRDIGICWP